jgi:hypothetical protein
MALTFEKIEKEAPALVNLSKKASFSLSKNGLDDTKARVALVLDHSYSMSMEYSSGRMQELSERVLALATQLDDNGEVEFFIFDNDAEYLGDIKLSNYAGAVDNLRRGKSFGGTDYSTGINAVVEHYFGGSVRTGRFGRLFGGNSSAADTTVPVFALFLTDGETGNQSGTVKALTDAADYPIFWKFLSIGTESFDFLQQLDDLDGRRVDNADYKPVGNLSSVKDSQLFDLLLDEYATWIADARAANILTT